MTANTFSESSQFEFVPLTPLEESFEDDPSPLDTTPSLDRITAPSLTVAPSLSIVTCETETSASMEHITLSSCDDNKMAATTAAAELGHYTRPPTLIPSLVDPALHNKYSRYLDGSFDSSVGYTTTDVTSDCGSVATHPLVMRTHKMSGGTQPGHKRTNGVVHKVANSVTQTEQKMTDSESQTRTDGIPHVVHKRTQTEDRQQIIELDLLWKQFLVSPLYTEWVEPKRLPNPNDPCSKPTCYCEELKRLQYKTKHHAILPAKPPMVDTSIYTTGDTTCSDKSTLVTTAVQTSPSLLKDALSTKSSSHYLLSQESSDATLNDCPCASSHVIWGSPQSSHTSTSDQGSHDHFIDRPASLTTLSLQEACRMFKGDFISNCRQRQKLILHTRRQREADDVANRHQIALAEDQKKSTSHHHRHHTASVTEGPASVTAGKAIRSQHPKMTPREMYQQSKRLWRTLPEVKQKQNEVKKKAAAAVNRMNMKLYQQKVLHDLRKKRM